MLSLIHVALLHTFKQGIHMLCSFFCLITGHQWLIIQRSLSSKSNQMSVFNFIIRLAINRLIELRRLYSKSFGVMNQRALFSFLTILIALSQLIHKTEHTLILVVITGLMQHSLLQLGFGMQDDIYVDSQLLMVHIQSQDIGCYY